ncbi:beta-glucuronosyltransferase 14A, partial [Olea europaea subsp. europaea]
LEKLDVMVQISPTAWAFANVDVIGKLDPMTHMGFTNIFRAATILLKVEAEWDWFVALNAMDYPLVT